MRSSVIDCIESGIATRDLLPLMGPKPAGFQTTSGFIDAVAARLMDGL